MLVITLRRYEELRIGEDITIAWVERRGNQIRVGVDAPEDVYISRVKHSHLRELDDKSYNSEHAKEPSGTHGD